MYLKVDILTRFFGNLGKMFMLCQFFQETLAVYHLQSRFNEALISDAPAQVKRSSKINLLLSHKTRLQCNQPAF
jgi:hypothetical protein